MTGERILAAIVFTDVEGFTARASDDESLAYRLLEEDFTVMRRVTQARGGRVLKTMGDGMLMLFATASDAVDCALDIQREFSERSKQALEHRIGVHLGDLLLVENDAHGDGVNVAARLQAEASPGGVVLSQTVYDIVRGRLQISVHDLGERQLKNLPEPLRLFEVLPNSTPRIRRHAAVAAPSGIAPAMFFLGCCILVAVGAFWFRDSAPSARRAAEQAASQPAALTRGDVQRLLAMTAERQKDKSGDQPISDVPEGRPGDTIQLLPNAARNPGNEAGPAVPTKPKPPATRAVVLETTKDPAKVEEAFKTMEKEFGGAKFARFGPQMAEALKNMDLGLDEGEQAEIRVGLNAVARSMQAYGETREKFKKGYQFDAMLSWLGEQREMQGSPFYTRIVSHWSTLAEFWGGLQMSLAATSVTEPVALPGVASGVYCVGANEVVMNTRGGRPKRSRLTDLSPTVIRALAERLWSKDGMSDDEKRLLRAFDREYLRSSGPSDAQVSAAPNEDAG
ncbi:MAG: adenylate/guanylate cyclase domain-containing protein [Fimbriimonas sp.]